MSLLTTVFSHNPFCGKCRVMHVSTGMPNAAIGQDDPCVMDLPTRVFKEGKITSCTALEGHFLPDEGLVAGMRF